MANVGRPPKYKSVEEIEDKIEQYFAICEGEPLLDDEGKQVINKYGYPCWIKAPKPPTVTGLALALGFTTRLSLLNYQGKKEFMNTITRAKTRIEEYAESRLFDRDGSNGAQFSLRNNFKGWNIDNEQKLEIELLKLESQVKDSQPEEEAEDNFMDALNGTAAEVWEESEVEEDGDYGSD
ncbi:terminase small subunit [Lachnospiraceae bacterium JLR.KK009]|nr:hypothetical protein C810_05185 [Lachnospiraceae bacterium A2]